MDDRDPSPGPVPVYIVPAAESGDDYVTYDMWRSIMAQKWIFLISVLLSVLFVGVYIFLKEPVYRAESYVLPPSHQMIQELLIDFTDVDILSESSYTPEYVYEEFLKNLNSKGLRWSFFQKNDLIDRYVPAEQQTDTVTGKIFEEHFDRVLRVSSDASNQELKVVSFEFRDPELAAEWLNHYIEYANSKTVKQLYEDVNAAINIQRDKIRYLIDSKLKLAEQRRLDTITSLEEAVSIAEKLGITDSAPFPVMIDKAQSGFAVNTAQAPLYMRGVKALKHEIDVLKARESDEAFIKGYRDLEERAAYLDKITIDMGKLSAVTVDFAATVPQRPQGQRVFRMLVLAIAFGLIIAAIFAVVSSYSGSRRS